MPDTIQTIASRYTNFTTGSDGTPEINGFALMPFEGAYPEAPGNGRLALVLVEPRLMELGGDAALRPAIFERLRRFKGDLRAEGLHSRFLLADLYRGPVQKDGRIVVALRRFFREVKANYPNFEGAVLIGSFPDSMLVRRVAWTPGFVSPRKLVVWTEMISERADIVLSDLNGNWESIYRQDAFDAEKIEALPDADTDAAGWRDGESVRNVVFSSSDFTVNRSPTFRDAFYMDDAIYTVLENTTSPARLRVRLYQAEHNNEVHVSERSTVNIIARPDIAVSRINARHVAVNPNPSIVGTDGRTLLDANGQPQAIDSPTPLFNQDNQWRTLFNDRNFDLERRLIIDYLDRNHALRIGAFAHLPFRGAVISGTTDFNPDSYEGLVNGAASDFAACVKVPNADLRQYVGFLKTSAILKYVMAHSNAHYSEFRGGYDVGGLASDVGGPPARWVHEGGTHVPSYEGLGGNADVFIHRALWQNGTLQDTGACFVIHGGCNVNSVPEGETKLYSDAEYGHWNNAEGLLFYTNAAALFSRAKGFNDAPGGFADGFRLSNRANFGSCMRSYFNAQANDAGLKTYNIQRKRAYFWSLNGDWTLRLRNENGFGLLELRNGLAAREVHPNRGWIDGWNYESALNRFRGIGDVDDDGRDEMVITSDWGIGILKHDGHHFRALMVAPRDTWFGGWRWDATINPGRDRIQAVGDFTGSGRQEIMVWSSWGIAALEYVGATLYPRRIHQNGTRLGSWLLDTADNRFCGAGQFDADRNLDMVVMSPWGLGILSLERSTQVFAAPNGARFGGWLLNSADNRIAHVADFDGDGLDEILMTSPWGIGILKMAGSQLTAVAMHANGTNLGGYLVDSRGTFSIADRLRDGAKRQIVVTDAAGMHVLELSGSSLTQIATVPQGQRIDGWIIDTRNNRLQPAGNIGGDDRAEIFIRSPWGFGVLALDTTNRVRCRTLSPYGSRLGSWQFDASDYVVGAGRIAGAGEPGQLLIVKT